MKFSIIQHSKLWFIISGSLVVLSLLLLVYPGLSVGIDFTGGTLMEVSFVEDHEKSKVEDVLAAFAEEQQADLGTPYVLKTHTKGEAGAGFIIRTQDISNDEHLLLQGYFKKDVGEFTEKRFTTIGPTVGKTLKIRSLWALAIASIAMVFYIAFAFRNIPRKMNPWKFGVIAVIALIHDIIITLGIFVIIGLFTAFEVNTLFISALLIILGYSVNDTIVIFDRVRENIFNRDRSDDFSVIAERGLQQSIARSINTSLSTLIPLAALFLMGGESIRWFVLTLIVGLSCGTYSSLFLATPLLVFWRKK